MKKESKAYSYEDQVWDAEMRLQLQRRRGEGEGGQGRDLYSLVKEAKLSQKQKVRCEGVGGVRV